MSRIRTIKPEWWTRDDVLECSLNARLLYLGMNNHADDFGNIEGSPKSIKAMVFPGDSIEIEEIKDMLWELYRNELLQCYAAEKNGKTKTFYNITTFKDDQRVDKPGKPRCPGFEASLIIPFPLLEPDKTNVAEDSKIIPVGKGKVGEGKGNSIKTSSSDIDEWDSEMVGIMVDDITAISPNHNFKGMTTEKWADEFRKMREIDNLPKPIIRDVWVWANRDSFWKTNILSPSKLREKFSQLELKMKSDAPGKGSGESYDGIPPPEAEPAEHNPFADKIKGQFVYAFDYLDDPEMIPPNETWMKVVVGNLVAEYSERWPKGPFQRQFDQKMSELSGRVLGPIKIDGKN